MMKNFSKMMIAAVAMMSVFAVANEIAQAGTQCRPVVTYEQQCAYAYACGYGGCQYVYQCQTVPVEHEVCSYVPEQVCEYQAVEHCDASGCHYAQEYQCHYE